MFSEIASTFRHFSLASVLFSRLHSCVDIGWNNGERNNRMRATGVKKQGVRASEAPLGAARSPRRDPGSHHQVAGDAFLSDEESLVALEEEHADGLTAAQIVEAFTARGVHLSEATFRKWVQLGLLPRSRRVGRKG
jgi:hypothetical protein